MNLITVDSSTCTQCNACIEVCPAVILDNDENGLPELISGKEAYCIDCFHCESVCPTGAFIHNRSKNNLAPENTKDSELSSDQFISYLQKRRSIRRYKKEKVDKKIIEKALEATRFAPTGINRQLNHWIIVSSDNQIHKIVESTIAWMQSLEVIAPEKFAYFAPLVEAWEKGIDRISRSAPHLAFCCGPQDPLGKTDADIATSHLELIFPSIGVGSCWAGYIITAFTSNPKLKKLIGLGEDMNMYGALMFGYPEFSYETIPARKPVSVDWR